MSKLIDADKLKASVAEKYVRQRKTKKEWFEESLSIMETIDSQPEVMITCMKCHGSGTYRVPIIDDNGELTDEWETCKCEVCHGTGKIALEFYEELQRGCRR
jgi:antirestriction protein